MPDNRRRLGWGALGGLVVALLAGCRTAPDMTPFSDATAALSGSIKAAGRAVSDEITDVTRPWPEEQRLAAAAISTRFREHWVQRDALADALTEYSVSLVAIVEAGEKGEESARGLAASFGRLCDAVGVVLPPALAGETVVSAAARVYGLIAVDRAARTLGGGMQRMQPSVDALVEVLDKDLLTIENALSDLRVEARATIEETAIDGMVPRVERNALRQLTARQTALRSDYFKATQHIDDLRAAAAGDASNAAEITNWSESRKRVWDDLVGVEPLIAGSLRRLAPVDGRVRSAEARIDTEVRLVRRLRAGLAEWAAAHGRLAAAALQRTPPRVEELVQAAIEARDLVRKVRAGE